MLRVGLIGWRGMVGSVLLERMVAERDLELIEPVYFSTSQVGEPSPREDEAPLLDAFDLAALSRLDAIVTCQGGDYTASVHPELRRAGWRGYWIDAASALRMEPDSVIVLDPLNRAVIEDQMATGCRDLIGGNCTVSLMLMGVGALLTQGWVEWISTMTYQAASGAGAKALRELCAQLSQLGEAVGPVLEDPASGLLELDRQASAVLASVEFPVEAIGAPLATSLIPWVDRLMADGSTREEWKGYAETNKILALDPPVDIDGLCVRVGALRCHSQGLTIKLKADVPLDEIEEVLANAHAWATVIENTPEATRARLTPAAVTGKAEVPVGRLRKMRMGPRYLAAFTVGDQLLWGAAEPLRRALRMVLEQSETSSVAAKSVALEESVAS